MRLFRIFEQFPRSLVHPKTWGYEVWFFNTTELCMKLLVIYPGYTCSDHLHVKKYEIFMALDSDEQGRLVMSLDGETSQLKQGDTVVVERHVAHSFQCYGDEPASLLEFSTNHREDDSYRYTASHLLNLGAKEMEQLGEVGRFKDVKVLCVGDLMWDVYWEGPAKGLSPEAAVPNVYPEESSRPGGLGNVASNILSLGGQVSLVAAVGEDHYGEDVREMLQAEGADTDFIVELSTIPTTRKVRVMTGSHHHVRANFENTTDIISTGQATLYDSFVAAIAKDRPDVIYYADYDKGVLSPMFIEMSMDYARQQGNIPTVIDPKLAHPWSYFKPNVYKPNVNRLAQTLDRTELYTESDIDWAAGEIYDKIEPLYTLITRGAHGMSLYAGRELIKHFPGKTVETFELSGAGDTVGAVIALATGIEMEVKDAVSIANVAGSLVVQKAGTATLTPFELASALEEV